MRRKHCSAFYGLCLFCGRRYNSLGLRLVLSLQLKLNISNKRVTLGNNWKLVLKGISTIIYVNADGINHIK